MKFKLKKRGLENEMVVMLILAVAIAVFSMIFINQTKYSASDSIDVTSCYSSVKLNSNLHLRGIEFPTNINCPARKLEVADNTNEAEGNNAAAKKVADQMYYCWNQYGEGKLNLFNDDGTFCAVCAFIDVKTPTPIHKFPDYLTTATVPDQSGLDYTSYLTGFSTSKASEVLGVINGNTLLQNKDQAGLPTNKKYAVMFVYARGRDRMQAITDHLTAQTTAGKVGLVAGLAAGAGSWAAVAIGLGAVTGPIGWIAAGAGVGTMVAVERISYMFSAENMPQWMAFTALREWDATTTQDTLKNDFGCDYFPAKLE
jgi:hypothetical protein